jgi:hypothetical protein
LKSHLDVKIIITKNQKKKNLQERVEDNGLKLKINAIIDQVHGTKAMVAIQENVSLREILNEHHFLRLVTSKILE